MLFLTRFEYPPETNILAELAQEVSGERVYQAIPRVDHAGAVLEVGRAASWMSML
jgi:hypothetical protein